MFGRAKGLQGPWSQPSQPSLPSRWTPEHLGRADDRWQILPQAQVVSRLELPPCRPLFDTLPHSIYWACLDSALPCWTDSTLILDLDLGPWTLELWLWLRGPGAPCVCNTAFDSIRTITCTRNRQSSPFHRESQLTAVLFVLPYLQHCHQHYGSHHLSPDRTLS